MTARRGAGRDDPGPPVEPNRSAEGEPVTERISWQVEERHRGNLHLEMLALQLHAWGGGPLDRLDRHRLATWRRRLRDLNAVVVYDRTTPAGFSLEPRQMGDGHLTRPPSDEGENT